MSDQGSDIQPTPPAGPEPAPGASKRKKAARPGRAVKSAERPAGTAGEAAAKGGATPPIESSLLGAAGDLPGAARRKGSAPEAADAPAAEVAALTAPKPQAAEAAPAPAHDTAPPVFEPLPGAPAESVGPHSSAPPQVVRKTGFWPVFLGGVVAAALGSAATIWALPHLPPAWTGAVANAPVMPDLDAIRAEAAAAGEKAATEAVARALADAPAAAPDPRLDELSARVEQQAQALANLPPGETAAAPAAPDPRIDEMAAKLDQQAQAIADLTARPVLDPEAAARIAALSDQAANLEGQIRDAAEQAQASIAAAGEQAQKAQQAAAEATGRAEAVAAVAALQQALDQGVEPGPAIENLKSAGIEPPAAVTTEVPTLAALQESFDPAARAALQAALRADSPGEGATGVIGNFLRAQTGARSLTPREGSDPDAILSRAGAAVDAGDIAAARAEIATLPEVARVVPEMTAWDQRAAAYVEARTALDELAGKSN